MQHGHLKEMIDQSLVVVVEEVVVLAEEEVGFLLFRRFKNMNHYQIVPNDNDVVHLHLMNLVYLIYHNPVLKDLVIQ
jgi:hypothetical protein